MNYTKEELLACIKFEISLKGIDQISVKSLMVIADILNMEVTAVKGE